MRFVSFRDNGRTSFGALTADGVVDLGTTETPDLRTALARHDIDDLQRLAGRGGPVLAPSLLTWLPPIPVSDKVLCVGMNYRSHVAELGVAMPARPSFFARFSGAQVGHEQPVVRPTLSDQFDFEGELAVIIGRAGRHITADSAFDHVAGYSCFADNSVRDYQRHGTQATAGKNFERSGAFGPWMVSADEVQDIRSMTLISRLNGLEVQRATLDDLIFSVPELIAYTSSFIRLLPGDVLITGTPGGVGLTRKPPLWMKAGDVFEVDISGVGTLRNSIIDEEPIA